MSAKGSRRLTSMALAAIALCCLGCVSSAELMQRWVGHPVAELVAARGPADRILGYPYGGRLYIWEKEMASPATADATGRRPSAGQRNETQVYREMALVGDDGVIVGTKAERGSKASLPAS